MKTIMLTLVIMSLIKTDDMHHQKHWSSKELSTGENYVYVSVDTAKVSIGDTVLFKMSEVDKNESTRK